jgi:hypothetical protein
VLPRAAPHGRPFLLICTGRSRARTGGVTNNSPLTNTGVICQEEMVATFCNVASSPNHAGYGTNGGAAATSTGITTPSPAIPACGEGYRHRQRAVQPRRFLSPRKRTAISAVPARGFASQTTSQPRSFAAMARSDVAPW